jgi:hypothetical protein
LEQKFKIERKEKVNMMLKLEDECEFYIYPFVSMIHAILAMMSFEASIKFQLPFGP